MNPPLHPTDPESPLVSHLQRDCPVCHIGTIGNEVWEWRCFACGFDPRHSLNHPESTKEKTP